MNTCISVHLDDNEKIEAKAGAGVFRPNLCIKATAPDLRERDVTIHGSIEQLDRIVSDLRAGLDKLKGAHNGSKAIPESQAAPQSVRRGP